MSDSILQGKEKYCFACGTTRNLHKHHIYRGMNRQNSEREGCWVWLCVWHHTASPFAVHEDKGFDDGLKALCQQTWEQKKGTHEEFMKIFGRNYLDEVPEHENDD